MAFPSTDSAFLFLVWCEIDESVNLSAWHRWYDEVHVPAMLTVRGINAATRFAVHSESRQFLAAYEIDTPEVFAEPGYREVRGWGQWADNIRQWTATVVERSKR